jgi:hypothetical protein
VRDIKYTIGNTYLPQEYGIGVSYLHKNKLLFTADFQNKNWEG